MCRSPPSPAARRWSGAIFSGCPSRPNFAAIRSEFRCSSVAQGNAWGIPLKIIKGVTLDAGSDVLEIAYLIEGLPPERTMHFGVEFNFAGMPSGADDRFFHTGGTSAITTAMACGSADWNRGSTWPTPKTSA